MQSGNVVRQSLADYQPANHDTYALMHHSTSERVQGKLAHARSTMRTVRPPAAAGPRVVLNAERCSTVTQRARTIAG